jgi:hypothetical protein
LGDKVNDPRKGANHWYSPFSMPKETQSSRCTKPVGTDVMDCGGGLESACGTAQNYKPGWAMTSKQATIPGVRDCYYKFFKL